MIGIFLDPSSLDVSKIKYSQKLISIFDEEKLKNEVIVFVYRKDIDVIKQYVKFLQIRAFDFNFAKKNITKFLLRAREKFNFVYETDFNKVIKKYQITFAIFPTPPKDIDLINIPFAASFQSLGHRLNPELIETAGRRSWQIRENISRVVCEKAKLIFIDSNAGKEYLDFYYKTSAEIIVIPHIMPEMLNVKVDKKKQKTILEKYNISKKFLFYPSQLWPHKNHVRILEAIIYLKNKGINIQIVFTASSKSINKEYGIEYILKSISKESNLDDNLIITGFLNDSEIKTLYQNALALIMPQLIPEPCIPFAEAMALGCPVIGSDIPGIKEQINGSGILVNPYSIQSIAEGIESLLNDEIRSKYIKEGIYNYQLTLKEYTKSFEKVKKSVLNFVYF